MDKKKQHRYNDLTRKEGATAAESGASCEELFAPEEAEGKGLSLLERFRSAEPARRRALAFLTAVTVIFLAVCAVLMCVSGGESSNVFPVRMTEILASNLSYPNSDGRCCDYIELYNSADYPVDLSGFQLGDVDGNNRYRFPSGTVIGPGSYFVVYCDKTVSDASYAPFGISRGGGETFYLIGTNNAMVDSVVTIPTDLNQSMILQDGAWIASSSVTPGRSNDSEASVEQDLYNPDVSPVRITELSSTKNGYSATAGVHCDWVELFNTADTPVDISGYSLSDHVGAEKYIFPEGTVLSPGGYFIVFCSDVCRDDTIAPFGLSQEGDESVVLRDSGGMIVEIVNCLPLTHGQSQELTAAGDWSATAFFSPGFPNGPEGHADYLHTVGLDTQNVVISEVMSASQTVLADQFGAFSDWVELYNSGSTAVDLSGWYLSDDPEMPDKWEFPPMILQPGARIVIHCSGRDTVLNDQIHTGFSLSATGETVVLSSFLGTAVDSFCFGASEENCSFIADPNSAEPVQTDMPTPGYSNDVEGYEQFCAASVPKGPLAIWEVMTSNDWYLPQELGACYDWVELRNISDSPVNLSDYCLTDDPDTMDLYRLPEKMLQPGQTYIVILSGDESLSNARYPHAGFSLNAMEDRLLLFRTDETLVDYVALRQIPLTYSYGRCDGIGGFFHMVPTPGKANNSGTRMVSAMPISEIVPGVYPISEMVTLPFSASGDIYYTTDGSDPDATCEKYDGPIVIDETVVIRAVSVEPGKLPSQIYTATFIYQEPHSIPVVSLVTDPGNLWGANGIYKSGNIEIKEEKRPANVSYAGEDGSFSLDCEISLHGATTVTAFPKKSFSLRFQDSYDGRLHYDVFGDGEVTTFKSLILRTAYEDTYSSQMRDVLMGYTASQVSDSMLSQKHKYVAVYLNGEYWGLYALRELHSEEHYASYMDVPASSVTMVKSYMTNHPDLMKIFQYCKDGGDFKSAEDWEYAKTVFDMESFADWIIFEAYVGNFDIHGNMRYYHCSVDGLWRCGLVDVDLGMFMLTAFDQVAETFHHGYVVSALMANEEFQKILATRLAELLSGPMSDENMIATIDMLAASIRDEIPMERALWGGPVSNWEKMVQQLKTYCDGRAVEMIYSLCREVGFSKEERSQYFGDILEFYGKT